MRKSIPVVPTLALSVGLWAIALVGIWWCWKADRTVLVARTPSNAPGSGP